MIQKVTAAVEKMVAENRENSAHAHKQIGLSIQKIGTPSSISTSEDPEILSTSLLRVVNELGESKLNLKATTQDQMKHYCHPNPTKFKSTSVDMKKEKRVPKKSTVSSGQDNILSFEYQITSIGVRDSFGEEYRRRIAKLTRNQKIWYLVKNSVLKTICSMSVGIAIGVWIRDSNSMLIRFVEIPGQLFKNSMSCLVLPLISCSIISAVSALETKLSGKLGVITGLYFLTTTLIASVTGVVVGLFFQPGVGQQAEEQEGDTINYYKPNVVDIMMDLIRLMCPNNIVEACFRNWLTKISVHNLTPREMIRYKTNKTTALVPKLFSQEGTNMLGFVTFSLAIGVALHSLEEKGEPLRQFIYLMFDVLLKVATGILWFSPFGVASLIALQVHSMKDPWKTFTLYEYYFVTILVTVIFHGLISQPLIYFLVVRKNPLRYMQGLLRTILTAFGTSSSSVTLPVLMKNLLKNNHVNRCVVNFVAPLGATLNMDGLAVYLTISVIFIAQLNEREMNMLDIVKIIITSLASSVGAAGIPMGGILAMTVMLHAVHLPIENLGIVVSFDWIIDRFCTTVNVMGDAFGAEIAQYLLFYSEKNLKDSKELTAEKVLEKALSKISQARISVKHRTSIFTDSDSDESDLD